MSHDEIDANDREALLLLRSLRPEAPAPNAALTNVMQRLERTLPAGAWGANDLVNTAPTLDRSTPGDSTLGAMGHALQTGAVAVTRPWTWAIGLTLAGGIMGGALHAAFAPEKVRVVYVDGSKRTDEGAMPPVPSREARSTPSDGVAALPNGVDSNGAGAPVASIDAPKENAGPGTSPWARERALLDGARRALAAGEPEKSLAELGKHSRAFPSGKLAEERDALVINALVSVARYADARQKADAFARRYPHSFLAPSVQAAIAAIPGGAPQP